MSMIEKSRNPVVIKNGVPVSVECADVRGRENTIAYRIMRAHEKKGGSGMHIGFDAMISHDITYVSIIQTARASEMKAFPLPYVLTNCHNSLCAVGGTINEDDHAFGLSAAKRYGGIYVPANQAVIHQFAREKLAGCGKMILGSDSHTRYGCYGTMGVGEGGGELVKQLLSDTWDIADPEVVLVWLTGTVPHGIGPHDVALALVAETFPDGFVKNRVLEFAGPGLEALSMDFRTGIDVMTTETSCLTSIWETDEVVEEFDRCIGRPEAYSKLTISDGAYYDRIVTVNLDEMESMIALPFHPSKAYTIHELQQNPGILKQVSDECTASLDGVTLDLSKCVGEDGKIRCEQGVIVGCAGGMYENIREAAAILKGADIGNGYFDLSVYPASMPVQMALLQDDTIPTLLSAGAVLKPCFCGPCFGAGDTPANGTLSIRHATRNFANREGSRPVDGQIAAVALMDARSIAATAANGGILTAATDIEYDVSPRPYTYDETSYKKRCWFGYGNPMPEEQLRLGPNITDWPKMPAMKRDLLVRLCAVIHDDVTTTDELIPSGETSSYRSNPLRLAEFTLSRRVPGYVANAKAVQEMRDNVQSIRPVLSALGIVPEDVTIGSCVFSHKPGDGSAREQAASCQRVLGGSANICYEYATKRYRSNCINWGIVPFTIQSGTGDVFSEDDWVYIPNAREKILSGCESFSAVLLKSSGEKQALTLFAGPFTDEEKKILADGCLMNRYVEKLSEGKA